MGRETKILLALLGLLAGVFVGVLSLKLLVPRPPAGAGPDIHDDIAAATPAELVEPPALSPAVEEPAAVSTVGDRYASRATFERVEAAEALEAAEAPAASAKPEPLAMEAADVARPLEAEPPAAVTAAAYVPPATLQHGRYVTVDGDSWWSLAERAYGDGRLYRPLFAWNRAKNPRVSAVPGTPLDLPTRSQLATAWPQLMPRE